jgi:saccharopine dehydrogenase-like NADP-dependent oxidoreductase
MSTAAPPAPVVLVLGCGLCCPPLLEYLAHHGIPLAVASRTVSKVDGVTQHLPAASRQIIQPVAYDIVDDDEAAGSPGLRRIMDQPSIRVVISMLPYLYHVQAAKVAIELKKVRRRRKRQQRLRMACSRTAMEVTDALLTLLALFSSTS